MFPVYETRIKARADMLIKQSEYRTGSSIDSTAWSMFFRFDAIGEVEFSRNFGNLATGKERPGIRVMHGLI